MKILLAAAVLAIPAVSWSEPADDGAMVETEIVPVNDNDMEPAQADDAQPTQPALTGGALRVEAVQAGFMQQAADTPQDALTLQQCINMALESNLRIGAATEKLAEMDAAIDEAATARRPTLTGQASYTRLVPQPSNPMADLAAMVPNLPSLNSNLSGNIYNVGLNLNHLLYTGGRVQNAQRIAEQSRVAGEWQQKTVVREIRRDVTKAYYQALAVELSVIALDSAVSLMEQLVRDISNAVEVGVRGEYDLLQAQVQLINQRFARQQAATGAAAARDYLAMLIGLPVNTPIVLVRSMETPEALNLPGIESMQSQARSISTDLKALEEQTKILEISMEITRAANLPTVFAAAGYSGGQSAGGDAGNFTWNNQGTLTLGLQWDIYDGGRVNHRLRQTQSQMRQLELNMENLRIGLDLMVRNSAASLEDAFEGIDVGRRSVEQTRRSYEISYDKYQEGMLLSFELLNAQNQYLQAGISYYASLSNFYSRLADLDFLVNE
ncbi:MAG: TolC family protein [Chitinispirillales bacterium]|nr:TolC family protein [Chitinispirillales bacterium]